ncbi:MAG: NAD(P)-dependent oxidoreductase [Planctomycetota bacterium]
MSSFPKRILVTGASGFVGGRLIEALRMLDKSAVGTIRHWTRAARPARIGAEVVVCDIENPDDVARAMTGVDAVVHCAYIDTHASIVGGTQNMLQAAKSAGVEHFIFISSAEVYDTTTVGDITEESPTIPVDGKDYKNWKIEAESLCREFNDSLGVTILRPSLIYGPFGASWSIDIAKRLQSGKWGLFEGRDGIANLVYVDDLVRLILHCLRDNRSRGQTFNSNGPNPPTWNEYFDAFNNTLGRPPLEQVSAARSGLRTKIMDAVSGVADIILDRFEDQLMEIYLKGGFASRVMKKIKGELDATPTGTELNDLYQRQFVLNTDKARNMLGFESTFDLNHGLQLTAEWLALHELLEQPLPNHKQDASSEPQRETVTT